MSAAVSCQPESPLPIQETPLTFHPRAQRNASRRRDARQQSRSFARWNESLRHSPKLQPDALSLSAISSKYLRTGSNRLRRITASASPDGGLLLAAFESQNRTGFRTIRL
jgi:hypothetical protein